MVAKFLKFKKLSLFCHSLQFFHRTVNDAAHAKGNLTVFSLVSL